MKKHWPYTIAASLLLLGTLAMSLVQPAKQVNPADPAPIAVMQQAPGSTPAPLPPIVFEDVGSWGHGPGTREIVLPPGEWYVDDTITILKRMGAVIRGAGGGQTRLIWRGPATKPVFCWASSRKVVVSDLTLSFETHALAAVVITNAGSVGPWISTENVLRNVAIDARGEKNGVPVRKIQYGVIIDGQAYGGSGWNCEHHRVEDCEIRGCSRAAIAVLSSQAHRCTFSHNAVADSNVGFWMLQASQTVTDNHGGNCSLLLLAGQCNSGPLIFDRNSAEHALRWAHLIPSSGSEIYLLRHNRCDAMKPPPVINRGEPTHYASFLSGCVEMSGNTFGSATAYPPSFMFAHNVSYMGVAKNKLSTHVAPVVNRIHQPGKPWGQWERNYWQKPDGNPEAVPAIEANLNATPQQPEGSSWPQGEPFPAWQQWVRDWRTATKTAPLPGVSP